MVVGGGRVVRCHRRSHDSMRLRCSRNGGFQFKSDYFGSWMGLCQMERFGLLYLQAS